MKIRINGMKYGKRQLLNEKALEAYELEDLQAMLETAVGISIFLKDQTRESEAIELINGLAPDFKGEMYSKATEHGWVVGRELEPSRDDSSIARQLIGLVSQ
tara:strand:- start:422 stop:727 length:306 start_codon:yes stop_codon:yes gene_type:complete